MLWPFFFVFFKLFMAKFSIFNFFGPGNPALFLFLPEKVFGSGEEGAGLKLGVALTSKK